MARRLLHVGDIVADIVVINGIQLRPESVGDSTEGHGPFIVFGMVSVKARSGLRVGMTRQSEEMQRDLLPEKTHGVT
jgi:hypothetical protein